MAYTVSYITGRVVDNERWIGKLSIAEAVAKKAVREGRANRVEIRDDCGKLVFRDPPSKTAPGRWSVDASSATDRADTMLDPIPALEAEFEQLAKHLTALMTRYAKEPRVVARLGAARDRAKQGAELMRRKQTSNFLCGRGKV